MPPTDGFDLVAKELAQRNPKLRDVDTRSVVDLQFVRELELGMSLIEKMSSADFEPERYADEYRERALALIEKKVEGQEIKAVAGGAAPQRSGRRYLRGVKEEPGNR